MVDERRTVEIGPHLVGLLLEHSLGHEMDENKTSFSGKPRQR